MAGNEFLLPEELGWEANDEISELIINRLQKLAKLWEKTGGDPNNSYALLKIGVAEIMDDVYKLIKKYQAGRAENE